jgi:hypothetical protein
MLLLPLQLVLQEHCAAPARSQTLDLAVAALQDCVVLLLL